MELGARIQAFLADVVGEQDTAALSAEMGYRSDVLARWIAGTRRPDVGQVFALLDALGLDPVATSAARVGSAPVDADPVRAVLRAAVGNRPTQGVAEAAGVSRHVAHRALHGDGNITMATFVALLEAAKHAPLSWFRQQDAARAVVPVAPADAARRALDEIDADRALVLGYTSGMAAARLPDLIRLLEVTFDEALAALPLRTSGRRRALVGVHLTRIDGLPLDASQPPTDPWTPAPDAIDADALVREFVRAVRGHRSQRAVAMRLGFSSNVVYRWESGRTRPAAADVFGFLERTGVDVRARFASWLPTAPMHAPDLDGFFADLVDHLAQLGPPGALVGAHLDRHRLARLRRGDQRLRLASFFELARLSTGRLLDLLESFVALDALPSIAVLVSRRRARAALADEVPDAGRVLLALRHAAWLRADADALDVLAGLCGRTVPSLLHALDRLERAGLARQTDAGWRAGRHVGLEHGRDRATYRRMIRLLLGWNTTGGVGRAAEVTFDQADVTPALLVLSNAVADTRRTVAEGRAPDASVAVAVQITPLDGEPLWVKRGSPR